NDRGDHCAGADRRAGAGRGSEASRGDPRALRPGPDVLSEPVRAAVAAVLYRFGTSTSERNPVDPSQREGATGVVRGVPPRVRSGGRGGGGDGVVNDRTPESAHHDWTGLEPPVEF